jgi:hypothetical protein
MRGVRQSGEPLHLTGLEDQALSEDLLKPEVLIMKKDQLTQVIGLGINMVLAGEEERQRLLAVSVAVDGLSALLAAAAGVSGSLSTRTSVLLTLTTSSVAALSILSIRPHRRTTNQRVTSH